jgi:pilus assembly protein CpaF
MEGDTVIMQDIFVFVKDGVDENGRCFGHFEATGVRPSFLDRFQQAGIRLPSSLFQQRVLGR